MGVLCFREYGSTRDLVGERGRGVALVVHGCMWAWVEGQTTGGRVRYGHRDPGVLAGAG